MAANALSPALLTALLTRHAPLRRLIVGYSGGLDSHVLLHLLARHRDLWPDRSLKAIYVDHGLQAASAGWSRHCARVCQALQVPFQVLRVDASPDAGESPEAAARRARYGALAAELEADAALLTAHHQDDQAET
ncbi:MAG: tRNA lysidine(34) synthetase TilS, partial [Candidatus Competibacter sp.]